MDKYQEFIDTKLIEDKERSNEQFDIWIITYKHVYDKFMKKEINLDDLYIHKNIWDDYTTVKSGSLLFRSG